MSKAYIHVERLNKNSVRHVYVNEDGEVIKDSVPYRQKIWEYSKTPTQWKDIHGNALELHEIDSLKEYKESYRNVRGHNFAGELDCKYQFIADEYKNGVTLDLDLIPKVFFDIEVASQNGFPDPWEASQEILSIAFYNTKTKQMQVFGLKDYTGNDPILKYRKFHDEKEMVSQFFSTIHSDVACLIGFNCLDKRSSLWTKDKIIRIGDSKEVKELHGGDKKLFYLDTGKKDSYEITLIDGTTILASENHIFPRYIKHKQKYKYSSSLLKTKEDLPVRNLIEEIGNENDIYLRTELRVNTTPPATYRSLFESIGKVDCKKEVTLDSVIEKDILQLMGLMFTDGFYAKPSSKYNNEIGFSGTDKNSLEYYKDIANLYRHKESNTQLKEYVYEGEHTINGKVVKECKPSLSLTFWKTNTIFDSFERILYDREHLKHLDITKFSLLSFEQFCSFFSGLIDGDGSVGKDFKSVSLCNYENNCKILHELLKWNGVFSYLENQNLLHIPCIEQNKRFLTSLTLTHEKRKKRLGQVKYRELKNSPRKQLQYFSYDGYFIVKVKNIKKLETQVEMCDIKTSSHYFVSNGIQTHNCDGFDIPYLINRSENIGIDLKKLLPLGKYYEKGNKLTSKSYVIPGIVRMDWMNLVKKYEQESLERYSLDYVSKHYLGDDEGKLEYMTEFKSLDELYDLDFNRFIEYNAKDVQLLVDLEKKKSFVDISFQLAYVTKSLPEDIYSNTRMWDVYIYNELLKKNIVVPKDVKIEKTENYEGAYVSDPVKGMHDWVIVRDVASEYPSCMISANMSALSKVDLNTASKLLRDVFAKMTVDNFLAGKITPEDTKVLKDHGVGCAPEGAMFRNAKLDLIAEMLANLFKDRKRFKKVSKETKDAKEKIKCEQLVYSIKILMNSLYGAVGSEFFRYGDVSVATSVTKLGQIVLRYAAKKTVEYFTNTFKYDPWIYSDTDSLFFNMDPVVKDWIKKTGKEPSRKEVVAFLDQFDKRIIDPIIKAAFQEIVDKLNLFTNHFEMVKEKTCNRMLLAGKKKYVMSLAEKEGILYEKNKYSYKGIEIVRTDTPQAVRDVLKTTVDYLFTECKTPEELFEYTQKIKKEKWEALTINQKSFPRGVSDMNTDWKPVKYDPANDTLVFKKGAPVQVKAAWVYNYVIDKLGLAKKFPKLRDKDKIKWVYLKTPNPFHSPVVGFTESYYFPKDARFDIEKYFDSDFQFEKAYYDKVKNLVAEIGWTLGEGSKKIETLF